MGDRAGQTCGKPHTQHRCFSRLDDAWRAEFGDEAERPRWAKLLSAAGDCYLCVPPDPGIAAASLGASESALPSTTPAEALHTFTLDSGSSRCFFRDSTTLTPLSAPVPIRLADPSGGPVLARSSTVLLCPAVDPVELVEVADDSGATRGAASGGAEPAGAGPGGTALACTEPRVAESEGAESGGAEPERAEPGGAELGGAELGRAEPGCAEPERTERGGTLSTGGPPGTLSWQEPLSPPQPREWFAQRTRLRSGAAGAGGAAIEGTRAGAAGGTGAAGPEGARTGGTGAAGASGAARVGTGGNGAAGAGGAARVGTGAGAAGGTGAAGPGGARTGGSGAAGAGGATFVGAGDPRAGDTGAGDADLGGAGAVGVLGLLSSTGLTPPLLCPPPYQSQPPLQLASPLPAPSPYTEQTRGLTERRDPVSCPALPIRAVRTGRCVPHQRPPPVPGTHHMALRPSSVPQRVPLSDFVAESEFVCPPSVGGECALSTNVLEDRQEDFECFAAAVPHLVSMLIAPERDPDALGIPTPRSYAEAITGTYIDALPPPGANIVDGTWIFRVKRLPGSPPAFKARYVARGFKATAKAPLDEVVMDVEGPLKLGAARAEYFLTIVDVYTRMTWVYVLSKKSDVAETVKTDWLPMVEQQQDRLVKAIHTDRGGEFLSKEFSLWLKKNGIRHSLTMPYSPAMNGIAERANWTITETARGLLNEAGLPDYFWPNAVRSACVAKNRALTHVGEDKWVPYVEWIGRKPKVDMLRMFGCMCMALVPKHLRHNKLGAKAIWAVHLGMAQNSKGWLLWDPFTKKFLVRRDCKFMENLMYKDWKAENEAKIGMRFGEVKSSGLEHVELPLELSSGSTTTRQSSLVNGGEEAKDAEEEEKEVQQVSERAPTLPSPTTSAPRIRVTPPQRQGLHVPAAEEEGRGKRRTQTPNRLTYEALGKPAKSALAGAALIVGDDEESDYDECAFVFFSPMEMPGEPATLKEALESSDAEEWKKAMESELKSIEENGTWELVELPEGRKASTSKWLFKIKSDADGKIECYKSRLVAKGYQQKERVEFKDFFSPVLKPTTLRTLLTGATIKGWVVKQMDVTTAFLNGVLEEEIFMAQPEGFDDGSGRVLKLKKALYGMKQAPRQWYLKLRGVLEEIGFTPSTADHSLFMIGEVEQRSFMVVYVDDILIFSPSSDLVKEVMLKLQDKFKCKALGDVSFYLGLHIKQDVEKRCMRVHQRKYMEALAANFGQSEGHVATPFPSGFKCVKGLEEESVGEEERRRFHSLVGSLMYAAVNTRPDVAFATKQLARVVQCPNEEQVAAGMRVAKYIGQTPTVGLQYLAAAQRRQKGADGVEPGRLFLTAFSDASFASEPEDMTSVGGFICCVGGGPTAWESKKQVDQALSSVESEYMALFRAVQEIVWQRRLLAELGEEQQGPTLLYYDSQGAIALAKNPVLHGITRHMRVKWHWTRSMVAAGEVELHYVKTTRQPAVMMTKRLVEQQHWKCCNIAGMALN
ncbi:unnamed protein product [Closterium sp. NIES-54]